MTYLKETTDVIAALDVIIQEAEEAKIAVQQADVTSPLEKAGLASILAALGDACRINANLKRRLTEQVRAIFPEAELESTLQDLQRAEAQLAGGEGETLRYNLDFVRAEQRDGETDAVTLQRLKAEYGALDEARPHPTGSDDDKRHEQLYTELYDFRG